MGEWSSLLRQTHVRGLIPVLVGLAAAGFLVGAGTRPSEREAVVSKPRRAGQPNRLAREKSPYLLQHADNPVDWYPWGAEAFERARREEKPIFLSIGYSTCHWCHVMEEESFESPAIAELLNREFVPIKVDREERPDVDALYMQAVMLMNEQGGWPLNVFLTPERKPFYGGTYFPPEDRWGRPGLATALTRIAESWKERRAEVLQAADSLTQGLRLQAEMVPEAAPVGLDWLETAAQQFAGQFDATHGGFGGAPKFPRAHVLSFLLRVWKRDGEERTLKQVERTLDAMRAGGIWDHLGQGFHRYSTDAEWRVPHFEKMLYDQALLARAYLEGYQATGKEEHARTAREIFAYVLGEMTGPEGGFYSAEDADSLSPDGSGEKREGAFYLWTAGEIAEALGVETAERFSFIYGVEPQGNAPADPMGEFHGRNILYQAHSAAEAAGRFSGSEQEMESRIAAAREKLLALRNRRPRPHRDDKILTDWNGLMISALAFGARVLEEPAYREAAERSADFILTKLRRPDGRLLHRYREGEAAIDGMLEDYAFLIHGLIDLYEATFEPRYLADARELTDKMLELFWDEEGGGFFLTAVDAEPLLVRQKELYDGAIPSGNSVALLNLARLGRLTADPKLEQRARRLVEHFSGPAARMGSAYPQLLIGLDFLLGPSREIILAGDPAAPETARFLRQLYGLFLPKKVVVFRPEGDPDGAAAIERLAPYLGSQRAFDRKTTAYVCRNYACELPTTDPQRFRELLETR
ncbi:MAG: thioredoxin domain-containing protein [Candidatus Omnitrophica bacterium CG11_big_fil_rev_8_21_14_0_20_64_10]|nr:MAG: thioredoxin domain-containing protein [Candidatus Omnitrophica bacterium CG11_big_fil_rev_8_21_14_0_20_64_10]